MAEAGERVGEGICFGYNPSKPPATSLYGLFDYMMSECRENKEEKDGRQLRIQRFTAARITLNELTDKQE